MIPNDRQDHLKGWTCKTSLKPAGTCLNKDRRFGTQVPKGLTCPECVAFTQGKKLSPHNVLFCTSKHPSYVRPQKSEFLQVLQKYFDGRLMELGWREPELLVTTQHRSAGTLETVYLTQWIKVGSTPQLVLYDRGNNANTIAGEMASNKNLEILSARAGWVRVAGGQQVSTEYVYTEPYWAGLGAEIILI